MVYVIKHSIEEESVSVFGNWKEAKNYAKRIIAIGEEKLQEIIVLKTTKKYVKRWSCKFS